MQSTEIKNADRNYFILTPITYCVAPGSGIVSLWMCLAGLKYVDSTTIRVGQFPGGPAFAVSPSYGYWKSKLNLIEVGPAIWG